MSIPRSINVCKTQAWAERSSGHKAGTSRSIRRISVTWGIRMQTWKNREWQLTPMPYRWSGRLGRPVPSGMGEGNNSPVGAIGATRLTGLNPGGRLCQ